MNILCSAGKGEMTTLECTTCALGGHNACGYSYSLLKSMFSQDEGDARREEIHVTDLTGCLRKAWYDKREPSAEFVHAKLARWMGTVIHKGAEYNDENVSSEIPIEHAGIVGRIDILQGTTLVDIKTTRWLYPHKLPYGSHALQVNVYAWILRKMGIPVNKIMIQYIDASGPTKCRKCKVPVQMFEEGDIKCPICFGYPSNAHLGTYLVEIEMDEEDFIQPYILGRKESLKKAVQNWTPPEKEAGYLCGYCSHKDKCQPEIVEGD